jgi:hypothetical protein
MAIWLVSQPQPPDLTRGLLRFSHSGVITHALKTQLRNYARSAAYPHRPQAARLLDYVIARGADLGPAGTDFAAVCDQIDRADAMLTGAPRAGQARPRYARTCLAGYRRPADHRRRPPRPAYSHAMTLILDATTANIAMHAITAHAGDREAHIREVEQYGQNLPEDSYGRRNRQAIAARETRVAARLRAIEHAYRTAIDHDATAALQPVETLRSAGMAHDHELELE